METAAKLIVISVVTMLAFEEALSEKQALRTLDKLPQRFEKSNHLPPLLIILVSEPYSSVHGLRKSSDRPWVEIGPGVFKPDKLEFAKDKFPKEIKYLLKMKTENQDGDQ